jgi:hypothetical protein
MSTSLFALASQYRELQTLADSEADIPEQVLADTLEGLGGELEVKAQNVAGFLLSQEAFADAIDAAAERMTERAKRLRNRNVWLKQYLLSNMLAAGKTKIESPELVLAVKKTPAAVIVFDEAAVPDSFKVQPPAPPPRLDKRAMADAMKAGTDVPGARMEGGYRLEIK